MGNYINTKIASYAFDEVGRLVQKTFLPDGSFTYGGAKDYITRPTADGTVSQANTQDVARKAVILEPINSIDALNLTSYSATIAPNAPQGQPISGLQKINYSYHIRGGLRGINLDASGNPTPSTTEADLFAYKLDYETAGQWDGNIGKQTWKGTDKNARSYTFNYDASKRLTQANFIGISGENYTLQGMSYDKNGNIKTLQRFGQTGTSSYGLLDNLTYTHIGNRLSQITDTQSSNNGAEFVQRGNASYTFYADGSLKSDANEQIQNIVYDTFLKQPTEVQLTDGQKLKNYYDGGGTLLKTVYFSAANTVLETWEFLADMVYKNGGGGQPLLYQINDDEGRILYENGNYVYEFDYKDHLGNTRVSFKAVGNQLTKTAESDFDAWGNKLPIGINNVFQNRWEMQGHEKEMTFGLNRVNFGARTYNPTTGRMDGVDELSELAFEFTPYRYAFNNPVNYIDEFGLFESRAEAREYKRENELRGTIRKDADGTYSINNKKESTSIFKDEKGEVQTAALVTPDNQTSASLSPALPFVLSGVSETVSGVGLAYLVLKVYPDLKREEIQHNPGTIQYYTSSGTYYRGENIYLSKGGPRNIWPDNYPKPNPKDIDWKKSDSELANELSDRVGDSERGPKSPNNQVKKWFRDKRPSK